MKLIVRGGSDVACGGGRARHNRRFTLINTPPFLLSLSLSLSLALPLSFSLLPAYSRPILFLLTTCFTLSPFFVRA